MEAESNRAGYSALKTLDREGGLRFPLVYVLLPLCVTLLSVNVLAPWWRTLLRYSRPELSIRASLRGHSTSVIYQVSLDHDDISRSIAQLPMERFSKPKPRRSTRHASHGLH
jgi:hypothetical protein